MITAIGALDPENEIFSKTYLPESKGGKAESKIRISKFKETFLKDLPISKTKVKRN